MKAIDIVANLRNDHYVDSIRPYMEEAWKALRQDMSQLKVSPERMVEEMDRAGIERAFLIAAKGEGWELPYEDVANVVKEYPDKFSGIAGFNPFDGMKGVKQLEEAVVKHGFIGAHVYPHWFKRPPNDAIYFPFYAKCVELDIPVQMQVGHATPMTNLPSVARPITVEDIAIYFKELRIIGIHIGYPWTEEMISVALRFPNVYIATDAHAPKYWEPRFVDYLRSRGKNKVLFGTDYPIVGFERAMRELKEHHLPEEVLERFLRENARELYRMK
jgi:predicted TIM-barrel fold metal-dependent hydrolase